ncbi:serine aminopeptidase domain-containing protein [Halalkalibacter urbisdiaboli]|uniref:serine aminopeptidase domain-containing protein n=1 Tax=Halalkalibacter urbisdiaboli TaxID=1960589 RepID=UPI000B44FB29|nr:alpha/beta hydrolase [Halalkalibacter urbisdiaboli]
MILVSNETIAEIPTLHVVKQEFLHSRKMPTVFFLHGYTSAKEHNLHVAYLLAEKGFRVLLPDAIHHGEREGDVVGRERDFSFWDIVLTSVKELEQLKQHVIERLMSDEERIGVVGTSMGAITTFGAMMQYSWINTAVSFMGTAYYQSFAEQQLESFKNKGIEIEPSMVETMLEKLKAFDPAQQFDKLKKRPLFIWHGKRDKVVPYAFSEQLYRDITEHYQHAPDRLHFSIDEKADHKVSRKAILHSVKWFEAHLIQGKEQVS